MAVTGISITTGKYRKEPRKTRKAPRYKNTGLFSKLAFLELNPIVEENLPKAEINYLDYIAIDRFLIWKFLKKHLLSYPEIYYIHSNETIRYRYERQEETYTRRAVRVGS